MLRGPLVHKRIARAEISVREAEPTEPILREGVDASLVEDQRRLFIITFQKHVVYRSESRRHGGEVFFGSNIIFKPNVQISKNA